MVTLDDFNKTVRFIDVDSKMPNLALMKLSAYYKAQRYQTGFNVRDPDLVFTSVIFKENKDIAEKLTMDTGCACTNIGGSGYDLQKFLPPEIEYIRPDYSLYPHCDYSLGYTTRGCHRNCSFCIVPQKEGKYRIVQHPREFHNPLFKKITLLDNNIFYDPNWFFEVTSWGMENRLSFDFKSGLDIRILTPEIADRLKELKKFKPLKFAFDDSSKYYVEKVIEGIDILKESGINVRSCLFYVYVDNDDQLEDAVSRCNLIKKLGGTAFSMVNRDAVSTVGLRAIKRWTRPWAFWSSEFGYVRDGSPSLAVPDLLQKYDLAFGVA